MCINANKVGLTEEKGHMAALTLRLSFVAGHKWNVRNNPCILSNSRNTLALKAMQDRANASEGGQCNSGYRKKKKKLALIDASTIIGIN